MNGEGDLIAGNFVLANTTSFSITRDRVTKSKWNNISKEREVIVGIENMVLYYIKYHPYLVQAPRYAL